MASHDNSTARAVEVLSRNRDPCARLATSPSSPNLREEKEGCYRRARPAPLLKTKSNSVNTCVTETQAVHINDPLWNRQASRDVESNPRNKKYFLLARILLHQRSPRNAFLHDKGEVNKYRRKGANSRNLKKLNKSTPITARKSPQARMRTIPEIKKTRRGLSPPPRTRTMTIRYREEVVVEIRIFRVDGDHAVEIARF